MTRSKWFVPLVVVITAIVVAFLVEFARGHDGNPYAWLGAVGGLAYLAAVVAPANAPLHLLTDR